MFVIFSDLEFFFFLQSILKHISQEARQSDALIYPNLDLSGYSP